MHNFITRIENVNTLILILILEMRYKPFTCYSSNAIVMQFQFLDKNMINHLKNLLKNKKYYGSKAFKKRSRSLKLQMNFVQTYAKISKYLLLEKARLLKHRILKLTCKIYNNIKRL